MRRMTVHAVMCWPTDSGRRSDGIATSTPGDGLALVNRLIAEALVVSGPVEVTVTASVPQGNPAQVLIDAAKDADLVVVGSRGHGRVVGALIGSVSHFLVTHAPCIVVVVPDADQLRSRAVAASSRRNGGNRGSDESPQSSQAESWSAMRSAT
jgi:hypothetical protein